jgi:DNA-binding NarL/FixJ family response regulator
MAKQVLIVDDHDGVRKGLRLLFELESGCFSVVGEAVDGRDAVEKARKLKPDLILLDLSMPDMNGLEVARAIRPMLPSASLMLFTLHRSEVTDSDAFAAGINAIISKAEGAGTLMTQAHMLLGV